VIGPAIDPHVEDLHRGLTVDAVVLAVQVVAVPADLTLEKAAHRRGAEVDVAELLARPVPPGADRHLGFTAGFVGGALRAHPGEAVDSAL